MNVKTVDEDVGGKKLVDDDIMAFGGSSQHQLIDKLGENREHRSNTERTMKSDNETKQEPPVFKQINPSLIPGNNQGLSLANQE